MIKLECLRDCDAACCKMQPNHRVIFDFTEDEAAMFREEGATLVEEEGGGYTMNEDCIFLRGKFCALHNKPEQPRCCVVNKAGGDLCLSVRRSVSGKRWNEVE